MATATNALIVKRNGATADFFSLRTVQGVAQPSRATLIDGMVIGSRPMCFLPLGRSRGSADGGKPRSIATRALLSQNLLPIGFSRKCPVPMEKRDNLWPSDQPPAGGRSCWKIA